MLLSDLNLIGHFGSLYHRPTHFIHQYSPSHYSHWFYPPGYSVKIAVNQLFEFYEFPKNCPGSCEEDARVRPSVTRTRRQPSTSSVSCLWDVFSCFLKFFFYPKRNNSIFAKHGELFDDRPSCAADIRITFAVFFTHKIRSGAAG